MLEPFVTVVEHEHYLKLASKLLAQEQIDDIASMLAADPNTGDLIQGTGGLRKVRYAGVTGKGKSGGMRVIYLYVKIDGIVHLLDIYGKNEKDNLTKDERNELAKLVTLLKGK